jgi:tungstate transport system permease protein
LLPIVRLSMTVSVTATVVAGCVGLPLGAALALYRFPGRRAVIVAGNALLGLPPVVVGLALYLLLSRSGPLGFLGLLFTPAGMIAAQALLATPIVTVLTYRGAEAAWAEYGSALLADGATRLRALPHLLAIAKPQVLTALLAGFGRCVSEVGAIIIVGGNIAGRTRTMTTAIVLETGMGNFDLALGLGLVLVGISVVTSAAVFWIGERHSD